MAGIKNKIIQTYEDCHRITEEGELQKKCSIHEIYSQGEDPWFPCTEEYFYKTKNKTDDLVSWCKQCSIRKSRQSAINRKEDVDLYQHEYYLTHQEESYDKCKKHYDNNLEKRRNDLRNWQTNNPEKLKDANEKRKHKNHKITKKQWIACKDYFKNEEGEWCCAYCGLPASKHFVMRKGKMILQDLHKEHVDDDGSIYLDNCVPSCQSCNSSKREFSFDDWYNPSNRRLKDNTYSEERKNKILKWVNEDYKLYL